MNCKFLNLQKTLLRIRDARPLASTLLLMIDDRQESHSEDSEGYQKLIVHDFECCSMHLNLH